MSKILEDYHYELRDELKKVNKSDSVKYKKWFNSNLENFRDSNDCHSIMEAKNKISEAFKEAKKEKLDKEFAEEWMDTIFLICDALNQKQEGKEEWMDTIFLICDVLKSNGGKRI
jgi:hypothetical protein